MRRKKHYPLPVSEPPVEGLPDHGVAHVGDAGKYGRAEGDPVDRLVLGRHGLPARLSCAPKNRRAEMVNAPEAKDVWFKTS